MSENFKEQDRIKITAYMKEKNCVSVTDLIEQSGAEKLRVYPLLFEMYQENQIRIVKKSEMGAPEIVEWNK